MIAKLTDSMTIRFLPRHARCVRNETPFFSASPRVSSITADHFVDLQPVLTQRGLLDEGADPADAVSGSIAVLDDPSENFPHFLQIRRLGGEPERSGLSVDRHRVNRLADLVSDRGGELPHCCNAIRVRQFRLCCAELFLGAFAFCNIDRRT